MCAARRKEISLGLGHGPITATWRVVVVALFRYYFCCFVFSRWRVLLVEWQPDRSHQRLVIDLTSSLTRVDCFS
jgi:hypothetical protein